jgi:pimeloyl-ACP methyl ester carboxylesterase
MTKLPNVHVSHWGESGTRIVLVHGGVQGSKVPGTSHFSMQAKLADRGYQLIVPDRPGHGKTPAPGRPDDAEADGEWVADLLGDGAHLVGHSFGGCVALAAASKRPSAVKTLTLIEPGMQAVAVRKLPVLFFVLRMLLTLRLSTSEKKRIEGFSKLMHIPGEMSGSVNTEAEYEEMGRAVLSLRVPKAATLEHQLLQFRQANIPLLVVSGGWSKAVDVTADVVAQLGNGRRVTIPSPHHFPQAISDSFNDLLDQFIRENQMDGF